MGSWIQKLWYIYIYKLHIYYIYSQRPIQLLGGFKVSCVNILRIFLKLCLGSWLKASVWLHDFQTNFGWFMGDFWYVVNREYFRVSCQSRRRFVSFCWYFFEFSWSSIGLSENGVHTPKSTGLWSFVILNLPLALDTAVSKFSLWGPQLWLDDFIKGQCLIFRCHKGP